MNQVLQFHIKDEDSGKRLDHYLESRLIRLSRIRIANLISEGACQVNQLNKHSGYHLKSGDLIKLEFDARLPTSMLPQPIALEILYEDNHILVLVKPTGMLVHPTKSVKTGTLVNALTYHLNPLLININHDTTDPISDIPTAVRPGLVHRLDKETSGLMVIAKHQKALSTLSRHFHHRKVKKSYVALLHGNPPENESLINAPIGYNADQKPHWRVKENGKPAETRIRVIKRASRTTLVELEPVTGRTNQLRIHASYIGHPIVGDKFYGSDSEMRLCLHASQLEFHHPANGEWMKFQSSLPSEVTNLL
jgi:23S rRNA pseudouridine1911/1915/1917 synthase